MSVIESNDYKIRVIFVFSMPDLLVQMLGPITDIQKINTSAHKKKHVGVIGWDLSSQSLFSLLHNADSDTSTLWQWDPWLSSLTDNEHVTHSTNKNNTVHRFQQFGMVWSQLTSSRGYGISTSRPNLTWESCSDHKHQISLATILSRRPNASYKK